MQPLFVVPYCIYQLPMADSDACLNALNNEGFAVYTLPGVNSAAAFFESAAKSLPLSPPLSGRVNWNAFTDSLWNGIDESGKSKVAILWHHAEILRRSDRFSYKTAVECMQDVISDFQREASVRGNDVKMVVIVVFETDYVAKGAS